MGDSDLAWQEHAACREADPAIFFVEQGHSERLDETRKICGTCVVSSDCLGYALTYRIEHGIWGGMTETERKTLTRALHSGERGGVPRKLPKKSRRASDVTVS